MSAKASVGAEIRSRLAALEPLSLELVDESEAHPLSFFETVVGMAYAAFADAPVDVAVVEVGMGGSWDATNVAARGLDPELEPERGFLQPRVAIRHRGLRGKARERLRRTFAGALLPHHAEFERHAAAHRIFALPREQRGERQHADQGGNAVDG